MSTTPLNPTTAAGLRQQAAALLSEASQLEHGVTTLATDPTAQHVTTVVESVDKLGATVVSDVRSLTWHEVADELVRLGGIALTTLGATATLPHGLNLPALAAGAATVIGHLFAKRKP